jgi:hypothetical protein
VRSDEKTEMETDTGTGNARTNGDATHVFAATNCRRASTAASEGKLELSVISFVHECLRNSHSIIVANDGQSVRLLKCARCTRAFGARGAVARRVQ